MPRAGFFLNGQYLDLHGVNRHQDRLDKGWAISDAEHDEDFAHDRRDRRDRDSPRALPARPVLLRSGDQRWHGRVGRDPAGRRASPTRTAFFDNAKQQLTELIRQNYNHPSIVFWGIGNEQRTDDTATNSLLAQLDDLDPRGRPDPAFGLRALLHERHQRAHQPHRRDRLQQVFRLVYRGTFNDFAAWADNLHAAQPLAQDRA